jgi:hypothetical protein
MTSTDLVVVVPGIPGITAARDGLTGARHIIRAKEPG